ncbi:MAG: hypothetical protein Q8O26_13465 [Phreatobacter sp.]|uniref:hypothetical protein n=1 Tax=Phreatobacter sp. TaxID=1966341 RepID=UPI0027371FF0|nr:hypothetical protein [Phreatobacter sp.]MDP2802883.1 hypothetical protein [Phreatobacter sp.]
MKTLTVATTLILVAMGAAGADECRDRLVRYLEGALDGRPGQSLNTVQQGASTTESAFIFVSRDHHMFKPVNPENIPWVLTYQGAMYQSADQVRTWTKVHSFDRDKQHAEAREAIRSQARSATGVVCGTETLDGVVHDTFDARMTMEGAVRVEMHNRYWISRESGISTQAVSISRFSGVEMTTTQRWRPLGDMTLPVP